MSDPFNSARLIREKYRKMIAKHHDRIITLNNLISDRERTEKDEGAKRAFSTVLSMLHNLGLLNEDNYKDEE